MASASAAAPKLTGGAVASVLLHGGLIAAFLLLGPGKQPAALPTYHVQLIAAPSAATVAEAVAPAPAAKPAPVTKPAARTPTPPREKVPAKKTKAAPTPVVASQTAPPKATPPAAPATPPASPALSAPGKGQDVANVNTGGVDFPFPYYTAGIVNEILKRFQQQRIGFTATVRFVIHRDGSVDPASIRLETSSGNYAFDLQAMGAVEAAANAKAFGGLPSAYHDDILPISFRFSPSLVK
ncbi:MAG: energy transducer TonB family protein [Gemmatimonadaceae bacterium]